MTKPQNVGCAALRVLCILGGFPPKLFRTIGVVEMLLPQVLHFCGKLSVIKPCRGVLAWQNEHVNEKIIAPKSILWWILTTGLIGLFGAASLTYERIHQQIFPNEALSCDFSNAISCGAVMKQDQAQIFGFANSWIGVAGFILVVAFALMQLVAKRTYSRRVWVAFVGGLGFAATFVGFLFSQSMFVIHILCPYCMVVWAGTIPLFVHVLLWARANEIFELQPRSLARAKAIYEWSWVIAIATEVVVFAFIYVSFLDAFRALINN